MNSQKGNILIIIPSLIAVIALVLAGYFFLQNQQLQKPKVKNIIPTPISAPAWKTYFGDGVSFEYPASWIVNPVQIGGSSYTLEINDPSNIYLFTFRSEGNYSQITGKPYKDIYEYLKVSYRLKTKTVGGLEAIQGLPRAGSESNFAVFLFSKDAKSILTIELDTPRDGSKIIEGEKLFDQILGTFRFLDQNVVDPRNDDLRKLDKCIPIKENHLECYNLKTKEDCLKMSQNCHWTIVAP